MPTLSTRARIAGKVTGAQLGDRLYGHVGVWLYAEVLDVETEHNPAGRQLLLLNEVTGECFSYCLALVMTPSGGCRIGARWLRYGDQDFIDDPGLPEELYGICRSFLIKLKVTGRWDPDKHVIP